MPGAICRQPLAALAPGRTNVLEGNNNMIILLFSFNHHFNVVTKSARAAVGGARATDVSIRKMV
jgi:hypothetical protein